MFKFLTLIICLCLADIAHADDKTLFTSVYQTIVTKHAEPVNVEKLAFSGLQGLSQIDKQLKVANGKEMVYLYYKGRQIGLWHKPKKNDDLDAWIDLSLKIINTATKKSQIASEHDFEITGKMLSAATSSLNDHSRYFSDLDPEENTKHKPLRIFAQRMLGNTLYLKIGNFNENTKNNITAALTEHPEAQGVILDLRGNRGGLFTSAIDVAKIFIDGGIITSVKGRDNDAKYYNADEIEAFDLPIVTLIDGDTASSAEVLAAALHEQAQAKMVGTNSFGKGSIQEMYSFENGDTLALTTAHFYTPSEQKIDKIGLSPNYCTFNTMEETKIDRASAFTNLKCGKQNRERMRTDIELAVSLLK